MTEQDQTASQTSELDKLLSEAETPVINEIKEIKEGLSEIKAEFKSNREQKTQEDVGTVVKAMSEKVPEAFRENPMFSADALEDFINREAERNESLKNAFLGRHKDSTSWDKARDGLIENFAKQFEDLPDSKLTEDREAALASAANQTKSAETDFDEKAVGTMPTSDFNDLQRSLGVPPYGSS